MFGEEWENFYLCSDEWDSYNLKDTLNHTREEESDTKDEIRY